MVGQTGSGAKDHAGEERCKDQRSHRNEGGGKEGS